MKKEVSVKVLWLDDGLHLEIHFILMFLILREKKVSFSTFNFLLYLNDEYQKSFPTV